MQKASLGKLLAVMGLAVALIAAALFFTSAGTKTASKIALPPLSSGHSSLSDRLAIPQPNRQTASSGHSDAPTSKWDKLLSGFKPSADARADTSNSGKVEINQRVLDTLNASQQQRSVNSQFTRDPGKSADMLDKALQQFNQNK